MAATVSAAMSAVRGARGIAKRRSRLTPEMTAAAASRLKCGKIGSKYRPNTMVWFETKRKYARENPRRSAQRTRPGPPERVAEVLQVDEPLSVDGALSAVLAGQARKPIQEAGQVEKRVRRAHSKGGGRGADHR